MLKKTMLSLGMTLTLALGVFQSVAAFAGTQECHLACYDNYFACVQACEVQGPNAICVYGCEKVQEACYESCFH